MIALNVLEHFQLEMFLVQRLQELQSEGSVVALSQFQSAPQIVQMQSQANVEKMLCQVKDLIARFTNTQIQHLFRIKSSPRFSISPNFLLSPTIYECYQVHTFAWVF